MNGSWIPTITPSFPTTSVRARAGSTRGWFPTTWPGCSPPSAIPKAGSDRRGTPGRLLLHWPSPRRPPGSVTPRSSRRSPRSESSTTATSTRPRTSTTCTRPSSTTGPRSRGRPRRWLGPTRACTGRPPTACPGNDDLGTMSAVVRVECPRLLPGHRGRADVRDRQPRVPRSPHSVCPRAALHRQGPWRVPAGKYVQSGTLDGAAFSRTWFAHSAIADGGGLILSMGPAANESWGTTGANAPAVA